MNLPVTYVEIHSPRLPASVDFLTAVFGWTPEPFVAPNYLVAASPEGSGVDTGLTESRDGQPRVVPIIRVPHLEAAMVDVESAGGVVVVAPFAVAGVGRGCYVTDPAGVLLGLHEYDPDA